MKTTGVVIVIIAVLAMAHEATSKNTTPVHHTAPTTTTRSTTRSMAPVTGTIAVSHDEDGLSFRATCDVHGAVVTLHPDNTTTRPAATRECQNAARDYAALDKVGR